MRRQCVIVSWLSLLVCAGSYTAQAAPIADSSQTTSPVEALSVDDVQSSDIDSVRRLKAEGQRQPEKAVSSKVSTGRKDLDLLLELTDRPQGPNGVGNGLVSEEARLEAARAARKRLMDSQPSPPEKNGLGSDAKPVLAATAVPAVSGEVDDLDRDPVTDRPHWSGNVGVPSSAQYMSSNAGDASAHRDFSYGADFGRAPTRKVLLLLREYREWLIVGSVAAALLALVSSTLSRNRRRRQKR